MDAANGRPAMERDVHEKSPDWEAMFNAIEDDRAGHGRDDKKARIEA